MILMNGYDDDICISHMAIEIGPKVYPIRNKHEIDHSLISVGSTLKIKWLGTLEVVAVYAIPGFNNLGEQVYEVAYVCERGRGI